MMINLLKNRRGMSLTFVLIMATILSFLIVPIIDIFTYSRVTAIKTKHVLVALNLASEMIEETMATKFSDIKGMSDNEWEPVEGEWFNDGNGVSINYPEEYKIFKRNLKVIRGENLPGKDEDLLKIIVTVKWDEIGKNRSSIIKRQLRLATVINRKERWE